VAIHPLEAPGVFEVSSSFCHPTDRKMFRKNIARDSADAHRDRPRAKRVAQAAEMGKAVKVTLSLPPDDKGNVDTALIVEAAIAAGVEMRSWAAAAYKRGLFYKTLRNDKMTWAQMVCSHPHLRQGPASPPSGGTITIPKWLRPARGRPILRWSSPTRCR